MLSDEKVTENTCIDPDIEKSVTRSEPFSLPHPYVWSDVDILDEAELDELYTLLTENYVEDATNMFRFDYSHDFLRWYELGLGIFGFDFRFFFGGGRGRLGSASAKGSMEIEAFQ